jgi:hypothetical protein
MKYTDFGTDARLFARRGIAQRMCDTIVTSRKKTLRKTSRVVAEICVYAAVVTYLSPQGTLYSWAFLLE